MTIRLKLITGFAMLGIVACGGGREERPARDPGAAAGPLRVAVVNYPLAYMAERIGGDRVEVLFPAPADIDPAFWRPDVETIRRYQAADLILDNGAGYAGWITTATLPASRIVNTSADFADRLIEAPDRITHSHGPEGEHAHGGPAFTTWLDLQLALRQAAAIRDALSASRPNAAGDFAAGFLELEQELRALDARLERAVAQSPGRAVLFSHPVYDYLARRYGIAGHSVLWEPDEQPGDEQWHDFEHLTEYGASFMIWEKQPLDSTVEALRERGIECVVFDPCENRPTEGDLLSVMTANAEALERVFQ